MRMESPVQALTSFGIAPREAKGVWRTLDKDVARMTRYLLADIERSAAPGVLVDTRDDLAGVIIPSAAALLNPSAAAKPGSLRFAALPAVMLAFVMREFFHGKGIGYRHRDTSYGLRPAPDSDMQETRRRYAENLPVPPHVLPVLGRAVRSATEEAFPLIATGFRENAERWTGWTIVAFSWALETHIGLAPPVSPDLDHVEHLYTSDAYRLGRQLLIATALDLIGEAG